MRRLFHVYHPGDSPDVADTVPDWPAIARARYQAHALVSLLGLVTLGDVTNRCFDAARAR